MRAEPSISPLALGICCAVVAGALALAPGQVTSPVGAGRGADIVALEGEAMNPDRQPTATDDVPGPDVIDEVEVLGRMTSRTESPEADRGATSCTEDCGAQAPTVVQTDTASDVAIDRSAGDGQLDTDAPEPDAPATDTTNTTDTTGTTDTDTTGADASADTTTGGSTTDTEDDGDIDSCRSPRAVAARDGGDADVAPASPCSQGRGHDSCDGGDCAGGRSSGATEV